MKSASQISPRGLFSDSSGSQITTLLHKQADLASFKLIKKAKSFDLNLSSHFGSLQTKVEFLELDPLSRTLLDLEKQYE